MSYPYFGVNGELNLCYLFMQELKTCFNNKIYPQTNCKNQKEDFIECHNRSQHRNAIRKVTNALATAVNVNVPHYHPETDSFVFDDGKVISNTDPIFKQYKWF